MNFADLRTRRRVLCIEAHLTSASPLFWMCMSLCIYRVMARGRVPVMCHGVSRACVRVCVPRAGCRACRQGSWCSGGAPLRPVGPNAVELERTAAWGQAKTSKVPQGVGGGAVGQATSAHPSVKRRAKDMMSADRGCAL